MKISREEQVAIGVVLAYAERFGYGSLITHLETGWARRLMRDGVKEAAARAAAGPGMPFLMQDDLLERGEWDETGARYSSTVKAGVVGKRKRGKS